MAWREERLVGNLRAERKFRGGSKTIIVGGGRGGMRTRVVRER